MSSLQIENSFQLEFIACYIMHLENLYIELTDSKDTKQRDRYTQLLAYINEVAFEPAYEKYLQISIADTDLELFSEVMKSKAHDSASQDLGLPVRTNARTCSTT